MKPSIGMRPTPWRDIILICGKCAKKLDGGYGPKRDDTLKVALRHRLKEAGRRRDFQIIETKCLGVCPKDATTMIVAKRPDRMFVIAAGTPAQATLERVLAMAKPEPDSANRTHELPHQPVKTPAAGFPADD